MYLSRNLLLVPLMTLIISCDSGSTGPSQTINTKTNEAKTTMDDNKLEGEAFLAENAKKGRCDCDRIRFAV